MGSLKVPLVGGVFELSSMAKAIRSPKSVGFILAEHNLTIRYIVCIDFPLTPLHSKSPDLP